MVLLVPLLGAGVALAPAAGAADDVTRPNYTVTSGPSCHPGGVEIEVLAGTVPYSVLLTTTRQPAGEDSAELAPGATVLLHTGDVDWGETIDSRLEFTALDGSGDSFADDLVPYSFTRPSEEDCAAIAPPTAGASPAPATVPGTPSTEADAGSPAGDEADQGNLPSGTDGQVPSGPLPSADGAPADGGAAADVPSEGLDLQVRVAASELPVAPVTRERPAWALIVAGLSLVGTAGGLVLESARRGRIRRSSPIAGA